MTQYYEVGLATTIITEEGEFTIIHKESFRKFKNLNDAQQYQALLDKLKSKKNILPKTAQGIQLNSFMTDTGFFTVNELDQTALKKTYIKSKLDPEELIDLGLTP